jgi:hypothetical protein
MHDEACFAAEVTVAVEPKMGRKKSTERVGAERLAAVVQERRHKTRRRPDDGGAP